MIENTSRLDSVFMQVNVTHQGKLRFQATARDLALISDQPLDNGGDDQGMTPPEWFLASLGSCVGFYAVKYLETRKLDPTELNITVKAHKTTTPPVRLDEIDIEVSVGMALTDQHKQGLERAVDACIIHNTLVTPPHMKTRIVTSVLA